ncbi:MAG: 7-cyano-7-deazaguanine synthase [Sulfolobales archaeon]
MLASRFAVGNTGFLGRFFDRALRSVDDCLGGGLCRRVVVLASGGLDTAVLLRLLEIYGARIIALSINTRSRAPREREALRDMLSAIKGVEAFYEVDARDLMEAVELVGLGYSAMTGREPYYVPARNVIFFGYALYIAEIHGACAILTAHNGDDSQRLPDVSQAFLEDIAKIARYYVPGIRICSPLLPLNKVEVTALGLGIGAPIERSWSCYDNRPSPCGKCKGCIEREHALKKAREIINSGDRAT